MIIRAHTVVTMNGAPIENGAVAVAGDRIVDVGKFSEISKRHSREEMVDLGEQALLPGLINAHCHLDYTCLRGRIPRQKSFTDWIRAINGEKAKLSQDVYVDSINEGFAEVKRFGTTTIANLTAFPELIARIEAPIRTWWFAELIDVRDPRRANEIDDSPPSSSSSRAARPCRSAPAGSIVDLAVEKLKSQEHWGLAPHASFTASLDLYRRCEAVARSEDVLLTTHLAESREEMSMFRDGKGPLFEFLKTIGRDMRDCGEQTPVGRFLAMTGRGGSPNRSEPDGRSRAIEVNRPYLLAHVNELEDEDFGLLERSAGSKRVGDFGEGAEIGTRGACAPQISIVHCPRSHSYFGHSAFQFEKLRKLGFNICLGTDSLASNEDLSLFAEMRAFQKEFPEVSPEEVLKMVTVNPALALGKPHLLGRIRKNCWADLVAFPVARHGESIPRRTRSTSVFEEIVAFDQPVSWSMIGGRISA